MYKPENQQLSCSMDQGATETDLTPNKQQQNILTPVCCQYHVTQLLFCNTMSFSTKLSG